MGKAWSRFLPAQPKCASVSRETLHAVLHQARRDGIGRENPGGRRRSRARRRYGSARHVDRRGMFPWFHVQQNELWHPSVLFGILLVETLQQNPRSRFIEPWECNAHSASVRRASDGSGVPKPRFAAHRLEETREPARRHEATTRRGDRAAFLKAAGVEKNHAGRARWVGNAEVCKL